MGRHVVSDVVVIFALEQSCERNQCSLLSGCAEQRRGLLLRRPGIFDVNKLSAASLDQRVAGYESQAAALSAYFYCPFRRRYRPARINDWRVGVADRDDTPFAVSDPFKGSQ